MEKTMRIEIWFVNGLFRAFPEVDPESIKDQDEVVSFKFRGGHIANVVKKNVNFMEVMKEN